MSIETKIFATIRMYLQAYEKRFTDPGSSQRTELHTKRQHLCR